MRWNLTRGLITWLALSGVGVLVISLPDSGSRLFSLSEGHGPSVQDAVGIVLVLIGWLAFLVPLFRERTSISRPRLLSLMVVVGAVVVVWSIATDSGSWWILGVVLLVAVQVAAAVSVTRRK